MPMLTPAAGRAARGGVYCRAPHRRSTDQAPIDEREHACRRLAADAGVPVSAREVFLDARAFAWLRGRTERGFEDLLAAIRRTAVTALFVYGIEELARHAPADVAELLEVCDARGIALHDPRDRDRDWNDPAVRAHLAEEVHRALQVAQDAAATTRAQLEADAAAGRPHGGGRRAFGYTTGYEALVESEAKVVREIFARFLAGESMSALAADLNARGVNAAAGGTWSPTRIARMLDAPRYAGFLVAHGRVARDADGRPLRGTWPTCVSVREWQAAQELRQRQNQARADGRRPRYDYLLTGLVECAHCASAMVGSAIGAYPTYACSRPRDVERDRCARHIGAKSLEAFVQQYAIGLLEAWDAGAAFEAPLAIRPHPDTTEPQRRSTRITVRDPAALDGVVTGEDARDEWPSLPRARRAAALRFLLIAVRVGPKSTPRGVFDEGRVEVIPGPLPSKPHDAQP